MNKFNFYQKQYDAKGFVLIRNYFTPEKTKWIKNFAEKLEKSKDNPMSYYEKINGKEKPSRIENFTPSNLDFLIFSKKFIKPVVETVVCERLTLFKDKINWKHPEGKGFLAHQDHPAWDDFDVSSFTTAAFFVDEMTTKNGNLEFSPMADKKILDFDREKFGNISPSLEKNMPWIKLEAGTQDLLIFNSHVPHRSGQNTSKDSRRIFFLTYNKLEEGDHYDRYFIEKNKHFPPDKKRKESFGYNKYNLSNPFV